MACALNCERSIFTSKNGEQEGLQSPHTIFFLSFSLVDREIDVYQIVLAGIYSSNAFKEYAYTNSIILFT